MASATSASNVESDEIAEEEEEQLVEASIIQLVEEDEYGNPTITGSSALGSTAMVLNEATGEVEVINLTDPTVSHEVEVVTVDSDRFFGGGGVGERRLGNFGNQVRLKNAPALLRNSRRLNSSYHVQEVPQMQNVIMAPAMLPPASASFMKASRPVPSSSSTPLVNTSHPHTSRLRQQNNIMNNIKIVQPSSMQTITTADGREQQYVILSDNGEGGLDNTEYSIVQDMDLQEKLNELLMQQNDVKPSVLDLGGGSDQQTIFICGDVTEGTDVEDTEIMQDGNFLEPGGDNIIYHMDEAGNLYTLAGISDPDNSGNLSLEQYAVAMTNNVVTTSTKKRGRKSTSIDPSKNLKKRSMTELKCMEPNCMSVCYNVGELRKHLTSVHDNHFDEETVVFTSEDAFKSWRESYERERMVSFIYRGGTKKIAKDQAVTYLICHRSGHYKPTMGDVSQRKRKMKPQGSCKMGGYCTAGIKLLKNLETGEVKMDICHTHYGHPLDNQAIPHLRVTPMLRNVILNKFKEGMTFNEVLEFIHHNPDGLEGLRLVDRRAVRNIFDQWKNPRRRSKPSTKQEEEVDLMKLVDKAYDAILPDGENSREPSLLADSELSEKSQADEEETDESAAAGGLSKFSRRKGDLSEQADSGNISAQDSKSEKMLLENDTATSEDEANIEDESIIDLGLVKMEMHEEAGLESPHSSKSKNNYTLRQRTKQSLAHLLMPKRHNTSPKRAGGGEADVAPATDTEEKTAADGGKAAEKTEVKQKEKTLKADVEIKIEKNLKSNKKSSDTTVLIQNSDSLLEEGAVAVADVPPKKAKKGKRASTKEIEPPKEESDDEQDPKTINNIEHCIEKLYKHGESGPTVLMYKKEGKIAPTYGDLTRGFRESDSCIVLQTPVQRQLMQMFPSIIGVEVIEGKGTDRKLVFVMVIDEYREAIPVAWMVADVIEARVITNFFRSLRAECGEIDAVYLMAPKFSDFHRLWCATFSSKPKYIQNEYDARKDLRVAVQQNFTSEVTKKQVWRFVEGMLTERSLKTFQNERARVKSFFEKLNSPNAALFLNLFQTNWMETPQEWALAYRIGTPVNTIFTADSFAKLKKFISFKGTKRLKYSVDHILKIGYDKCFLRSKRMFKGDQKHSQHLEEINRRHLLATKWRSDCLQPGEDNFNWFVQVPGRGQNSEPILVTDVKSSCQCKTTCKHCQICMHMYLCSCQDFGNLQIMCEHIHFVHCTRSGMTNSNDNDLLEGEDQSISEIKIVSTAGDLPNSTFIVYEEDSVLITQVDADAMNDAAPNLENSEKINIEEALKAAGILDDSSVEEEGQEKAGAHQAASSDNNVSSILLVKPTGEEDTSASALDMEATTTKIVTAEDQMESNPLDSLDSNSKNEEKVSSEGMEMLLEADVDKKDTVALKLAKARNRNSSNLDRSSLHQHPYMRTAEQSSPPTLSSESSELPKTVERNPRSRTSTPRPFRQHPYQRTVQGRAPSPSPPRLSLPAPLVIPPDVENDKVKETEEKRAEEVEEETETTEKGTEKETTEAKGSQKEEKTSQKEKKGIQKEAKKSKGDSKSNHKEEDKGNQKEKQQNGPQLILAEVEVTTPPVSPEKDKVADPSVVEEVVIAETPVKRRPGRPRKIAPEDQSFLEKDLPVKVESVSPEKTEKKEPEEKTAAVKKVQNSAAKNQQQEPSPSVAVKKVQEVPTATKKLQRLPMKNETVQKVQKQQPVEKKTESPPSAESSTTTPEKNSKSNEKKNEGGKLSSSPVVVTSTTITPTSPRVSHRLSLKRTMKNLQKKSEEKAEASAKKKRR